MPLNFKFVSAGQSLTDAANFSQTLRGNSLKPLAPYNLRAIRDASNNMFIEWDRRSRIAGGLRPSTGVPLAEEVERYRLETYSGSSLVSTYFITVPPTTTPFLLNRTNTIAGGTPDPLGGRHVTQQSIDARESFVEATVDLASSQSVGLVEGTMTQTIDTDDPSITTWSADFTVTASVDGTFGFTVTENGVLKYSQGIGYADPFARIRVRVNDGRIEYYLNPSGSDDLPLFVSQIPLAGRELHGYFFSGDGTITDHKFKRSLPYFPYSVTQQTDDGFTPPTPIKVRVRQISAVVGAGPYVEATL